MGTEIMVFLAYGLGIFIIFFFGRLLLLPLKFVGRLIANSLLGAGLIALINICLLYTSKRSKRQEQIPGSGARRLS